MQKKNCVAFMVRKKVNRTSYQQSPSLQEQSYGNDTDVVSFPLQHVGKVTVIFLWIPLQPSFFCLQSATLYILLQIVIGMILAVHVFLVERVGSDPWYRDMIAYGAVAFFCKTLRFGFNIRSRIKNDSQQQSNCKYVDYLIKKKKIIYIMKLALTSF